MADRIGRTALTSVRRDRAAFERETFGSTRVRVPVASKAPVTGTASPAPAIAPTRREVVAPHIAATPTTRVTTTRTVRPVSTTKGPTTPPPTQPSGPSVLPPPAPAPTQTEPSAMIQANPFPVINTGNPRAVRRDFDLGGAIRGAAGALAGGGGWTDAAAAGVAGGFTDGGGGGSEPPSGSPTVPGNFAPSGGQTPCPDGTFSILGRCVDLQPGGATQGAGMVVSGGEPVLGRYGVAMVPQAMERVRRRCPRGMVLGMDNLCYNKRDLRKDERKWIPPRKPLLTGGDLNAISTALSAAKKLDRQKKRLRMAARAFDRVS